MSVAIPFNLDKFRTDYQWLESFMHKSEALQEIATLAKSPNLIQQPSKEAPYFNRWKVVWIHVTMPLYVFVSIFFRCISYLANCIYLAKGARIFTVLSKQMLRDVEQLDVQWEFKSPLLVPSINRHQISTWDLYQHGNIPYDSISDVKVKAVTRKGACLKARVELAVSHTLLMKYIDALKKEPNFEPSSGLHKLLKSFLGNFSRTTPELPKAKVEIISPHQEKELYKYIFHFLLKVSATDENFLKWKSALLEELQKKYPLFDAEKCVDVIYDGLQEQKELGLHNDVSISLYSGNGVCRGGTLWFAFLYHKTRHLFNDPTQHLMAIAQQFITGMPKQAAVLQGLLLNHHKFLQLRKKEAVKVSSKKLDHDIKAAQKKLDSLPVGFYEVSVYRHEFVFVKHSATEQYVWDPNFGLFQMNHKEMLELIIKHYHKSGNPNSRVELRKMTMA